MVRKKRYVVNAPIVRKRQTTRPGELVFMRHSKNTKKLIVFRGGQLLLCINQLMNLGV